MEIINIFSAWNNGDEWWHVSVRDGICCAEISDFIHQPGNTRHCYHTEAEANGRHFTDDICKSIFLNKNMWISLKISLKFVPKVRINNIPALVQIMAWHRPGGKPLSELMMVNSLTHICLTGPQLTRWNVVKHICVTDRDSIGAGNILLPGRCQAIVSTKTGKLPIEQEEISAKF